MHLASMTEAVYRVRDEMCNRSAVTAVHRQVVALIAFGVAGRATFCPVHDEGKNHVREKP
jgi:hypothetical protein